MRQCNSRYTVDLAAGGSHRKVHWMTHANKGLQSFLGFLSEVLDVSAEEDKDLRRWKMKVSAKQHGRQQARAPGSIVREIESRYQPIFSWRRPPENG